MILFAKLWCALWALSLGAAGLAFLHGARLAGLVAARPDRPAALACFAAAALFAFFARPA